MIVDIEYRIRPNEHGLIVLEGNPNGGTPYDDLVLYVEEGGKVEVDIRTTYTSNDGTPTDEWHLRTLAFTVASASGGPRVVVFDDIRHRLAGYSVQRLLMRIIAGHAVVWDGSNYVGRLTDDAEEARDELERLFEGMNWDCGWEAWDATEWLVGVRSDRAAASAIGLTADSDLEDIDRLVDECYQLALSDQQWIVGGKEALGTAILDLQQRLRDAEDGE